MGKNIRDNTWSCKIEAIKQLNSGFNCSIKEFIMFFVPKEIFVAMVIGGVIIIILNSIGSKKNRNLIKKIYLENGILCNSNEIWDKVKDFGTILKSTKLELEGTVVAINASTSIDEFKNNPTRAFAFSSVIFKGKVQILEMSELQNEVNGLVWKIITVNLQSYNPETKKEIFGTRIFAFLFFEKYCIAVTFESEGDHINKIENKYDVLLGCFKKIKK
jgi:hypothetical protein